ncbi:MAG TPA: nitroreductase/quinone reductase family protein [Trebonia sp.]
MSKTVRALKAWQYRGGRPHRWARIENRLWATVFAAGFWNRAATLEVYGRKSGRLISFPVAIAEHHGDRYLVAMLGERTNWVRNVRAAGGSAVLRQGRRRGVHLEEIPVEQRAPVLRRYLNIAPGARPHFPVTRGAPLEDFARIAARYPVFRITFPGGRGLPGAA